MLTIMPDPSSESNNWKNAMKRPKRGVPEGLWMRCPGCEATIFRKEAEKRLGVCPECDYHWYVSARQRIRQLFDEGTFEEWDADLEPTDPLDFVDKAPYRQKLKDEQSRTGLKDAALSGTGMIRARRVAFSVTDSAFIMGSMGSVVGEKLTRAIERATEKHLPLIIVSGSGGGAPSFASLGDVVFAEPKALIGFAGPRTIKATIRIELPKGFQTSEFLLEHGFIDRIVRRADLKTEIARAIDYCGK